MGEETETPVAGAGEAEPQLASRRAPGSLQKTAPSEPHQAHGREALTSRGRADEPSPDGRALPCPAAAAAVRALQVASRAVPAVPKRSLKYRLRQSPRHPCMRAGARGCGDTDSAVADWFTFTRNRSKLVPLLFTTISCFGVTGGSKILEPHTIYAGVPRLGVPLYLYNSRGWLT